jgi:hypothetical protein
MEGGNSTAAKTSTLPPVTPPAVMSKALDTPEYWTWLIPCEDAFAGLLSSFIFLLFPVHQEGCG